MAENTLQVTYKGQTIVNADISSSEVTKTLNTQGKYCEGNIVIKAQGGSGGGSGEVVQVNNNTKSLTNKTSLTATGLSVVAEETGTYTISWAAWRSYNASTFSTRVYVGGSAKGTDHTTWTNTYGQFVKETGISVTKGQTVEVYARTSSGSSRVIAVNNLIMVKN